MAAPTYELLKPSNIQLSDAFLIPDYNECSILNINTPAGKQIQLIVREDTPFTSGAVVMDCDASGKVTQSTPRVRALQGIGDQSSAIRFTIVNEKDFTLKGSLTWQGESYRINPIEEYLNIPSIAQLASQNPGARMIFYRSGDEPQADAGLHCGVTDE